MAEQRKPQATPNREPEKQRPSGKTGRDDTFRDTERARQADEGGEEWHQRGDNRGERGETGEDGSSRR
jgi:hypothetical protein